MRIVRAQRNLDGCGRRYEGEGFERRIIGHSWRVEAEVVAAASSARVHPLNGSLTAARSWYSWDWAAWALRQRGVKAASVVNSFEVQLQYDGGAQGGDGGESGGEAG